MLLALKKSREEREEGFTLIELLVVILIIGILSAIAIPAFMNQRKSAVDSTLQSDVSNVAKGVENWIVKQGAVEKTLPLASVSNYDGTVAITPSSGLATELASIKVSDGTIITATGSSFAYCLVGKNAGGDQGHPDNGGFTYASKSGGLQKTSGSCLNGVFTPGAGGSEEATPPAGSSPVAFELASNRTASVQDTTTGNEVEQVSYTVSRVQETDGSYTYSLTFSKTGFNGNVAVGVCDASEGMCYDFPFTITNSVGTGNVPEEYDTFGGVMEPMDIGAGKIVYLY